MSGVGTSPTSVDVGVRSEIGAITDIGSPPRIGIIGGKQEGCYRRQMGAGWRLPRLAWSQVHPPPGTPQQCAPRKIDWRSTPHASEPGGDINGLDDCLGCRAPLTCGKEPCALLKMLDNRVGDEPGSDRIHVPVAIAALLVREKTLRHDQVQMILGARHRNVKQPALFLDLGRASHRKIGGAQPSTQFNRKTDFHSCPFAE